MPASSGNGRKRVLFITYNFPPKLGGIEQVVMRTWTALSARAEVVTIAQHGGDHVDDAPGILRPGKSGLLAFFAFAYRQGRREIAKQPFDIIVSMSALTALPAVHLARRANARATVIIYGLDTIYKSPIYQAMYRFAMPKMQRVIAISRATREAAIARGVPAERICIVHPGCDAESFLAPCETAALRTRWKLDGAKVVLIAGRIVTRKGVDRFVRDGLPAIVAQVPDAKLLLAGGNAVEALAHTHDAESEVTRAIEAAGMSDHVTLTGRLSQDEMIAAFQIADVVVLPVVPVPGDMEGFGIVLIEAAAAGKATVATRSGGIPDAIVDGETGVLVEPLDYGAMAEAITSFLQNPERRHAAGEAGRRRVLGAFTWKICAENYASAILDDVPP